MEPAIDVRNMSKQYRIQAPEDGSVHSAKIKKTIWALKDISFEVRRGEVLGLIGRNGAGKSTLLKILSRITEPSGGMARIKGRIGSLLEVGTGFHPELTGRENIYLSGSILGMKKSEIDRKYDDIVTFAEVREFIETPVKRYSSGMYVRLAFSVAAHLEPAILLIDEVLAVGDLSFQQKCLSRIKQLTSEGMTVLLVSHNMAAIQSSCGRAIFLKDGAIAAEGTPLDSIHAYQESLMSGSPETTGKNQVTGELISIRGFEMMSEDGMARREFKFGEQVRVRIHLCAHRRIDSPMINFGIRRGDGVVVCNFNNWYDNFQVGSIEGECTMEGWLPALRLVPDFYEAHVLVWHWGGGHLAGDLSRSRPLAWSVFGEFRITGPGLNSHDGVIQMPARKWQFNHAGQIMESGSISAENIYRIFE